MPTIKVLRSTDGVWRVELHPARFRVLMHGALLAEGAGGTTEAARALAGVGGPAWERLVED